MQARPTETALYPILVHRLTDSIHASFGLHLAIMLLRFTRSSPPSG